MASDNMNSGANSLDLVMDEILDQLRAGKQPLLEEFLARFPENASEIRDVFPALIIAERIKQDSLVGNSTAKTLPPNRGTEHQLILGVLALQCGLIVRTQFLEAFEEWNANRTRSFQSILVSHNFIHSEACELLNRLADQQLEGNDIVDQSLSQINGEGKTHIFSGTSQSGTQADDTHFKLYENSPPRQRFEIIRPLDRGGLGIVSVALDTELNREVAFKEIRDDRVEDATHRQKFWLEAQLTGGLEHPGIIPIYGLGKSASGKPYYAMRLIKGSNLHVHVRAFHERVQQGKTEFDGQSLRRILRRFLDVCEAISYAHSRGVLHRDLKPANIMLGPYGETLVVDWGLAKAMGISSAPDSQLDQDASVMAEPETPIRRSGSNAEATRHGSIVGTPSYAPPEQLSGQLDLIEVRSDVYGLGAILYEILTGQSPASGSLLDVIRTITTGKVTPARTVNSQVPKSLDAVCRKAMALAPDDRYESASELRADVERWLDDAPVKAYTEPMSIRFRRWLRKHPATVSTLSAITIMLLVGTAFFATLVSQNNSKLGKLNSELLDSNRRERLSAEFANEQSQIARSQSRLSLSTLNSVLLNVQSTLRTLPGGATVRRAIITSSLASLDKVVTEVADKSMADQSTMTALIELADVAVQVGTGNQNSGVGKLETGSISVARLNSEESKSAARIASAALAKACEIGNRLYAESKNKVIGNELYRTNFALAHNKMRVGDSDAAAGYFEEALRIGQELIISEPENTKFRGLVARTKTAYGELLRRSSRLELAAKQIRESLEESRALAVIEPNNPWFRELLAESLEYAGEVEVAAGDLNSADVKYLESIDIRKQLLSQNKMNLPGMKAVIFVIGKRGLNLLSLGQLSKAVEAEAEVAALHREIQRIDPNDNQSQVELANSLERRAKLIATQGNADEAVEFHKQAMEVRKRMADEDPADMLRKRALSISYDNLGKAELKRGNVSIAMDLLQKSLTTSRELLEKDFKNTTKRKDVGLSLTSVGSVQLQEGKLTAAIPLYQESLGIFQSLAEEDPENAIKQRDLMIGRARLAEVYMSDNQMDEAMVLYNQAVQSVRARVEKNPNLPQGREDLSILLESIGVLQLQSEHPAEALASLEECLALRTELSELDPSNLDLKSLLGSAALQFGITLKQLEKLDKAIEILNRAIEIFVPITEKDTGNLESVSALANARSVLGDILFRQGKLELAMEFLKASRSAMDQLLAKTPDNVEWRTRWAEASTTLAALESAMGQPAEGRKRIDEVLQVLDDMIEKRTAIEWVKKFKKAIQSDEKWRDAPK